MGLLILPVKSLPILFHRDKKSQIIFVDLFFWIIIIIPDKAGIFPVLGYGSVSQDFFIFVFCIQVKNKNPTGIQIVVYQPEYFQQILFFRYIIHAVTDRHHCPDSAVKFKFPHVLKEIEDVLPLFFLFLHGDLQHVHRIVHTDHVVSLPGQKTGHISCPAAQLQDQSIPDPLVL